MKKINNPQRLQELMTQKNWEQSDVARILGFAEPDVKKQGKNHHRTIYSWLNGERTPAFGWENLFKILEK